MYLSGDRLLGGRRDDASGRHPWMGGCCDVGRTDNRLCRCRRRAGCPTLATPRSFLAAVRRCAAPRSGCPPGNHWWCRPGRLRLLSVAGPLATYDSPLGAAPPASSGRCRDAGHLAERRLCLDCGSRTHCAGPGCDTSQPSRRCCEAAGITFFEAGQGIRSLSRLLAPLRASGRQPGRPARRHLLAGV